MSSFLSPKSSIAIPLGAIIPPSWIWNCTEPYGKTSLTLFRSSVSLYFGGTASNTSSFRLSYPPGTRRLIDGMELNSMAFLQARTRKNFHLRQWQIFIDHIAKWDLLAAFVAFWPCESFPNPHSMNRTFSTWGFPSNVDDMNNLDSCFIFVGIWKDCARPKQKKSIKLERWITFIFRKLCEWCWLTRNFFRAPSLARRRDTSLNPKKQTYPLFCS